VDHTTCYEHFEDTKFGYGTSFRVIQELYYNEIESLSYLQLPPSLLEDFDQFILHPSLIDGALQTLVGLNGIDTGERNLDVPFAAEEVEIIHPLTKRCLVYVTRTSEDTSIKKVNIWIMDEMGNVLVKIKNFLVRKINKKTDQSHSAHDKNRDKKELIDLLDRMKSGQISIEQGEKILEGMYE
jgi:hypothetical protein